MRKKNIATILDLTYMNLKKTVQGGAEDAQRIQGIIQNINVTLLKITEVFQSNKLCKMKKRDSHTDVAKRLQETFLNRDLSV